MYKEFEPGALPLADVEPDLFAEIPSYLSETYWWAYIHPRAVRFFDTCWRSI